MNWEKIRSPYAATLKNPRSFVNLEKLGKYSLIPTLKSSDFEAMDEWGKLIS